MDLERNYNFINQRITRIRKETPIFLFTSIFAVFISFALFIFGLLIFIYYFYPNDYLSLLLFLNENIIGNVGLTSGGLYNEEGSDIIITAAFFISIGIIGLRYSLKSFLNNIYYYLLIKHKKYDFNFSTEEIRLAVSFLRELPISKEKLEEKKVDHVIEKIILILFFLSFISTKNGQIHQTSGFELLI